MNFDLDGLIPRLEDIVGSDHVTANPSLEIDSVKPGLLVSPASRDEAAACLQLGQSSSASVVPAGAGTWLNGGNPVRAADVVLSLRRMNNIVEYSPPDLTATLESGVSLREFNLAANKEMQWLPLDPPGYRDSTVGAMIACASSGPLRFGFGTPRDYALGLALAHADGTVSKCGGKVVKNVAGYDMNKLYTGSFGTLAVITQVTLKLRPLPERSCTVFISGATSETLFETARAVLASTVRPASIFVLSESLSRHLGLGGSRPALLVRFLDSRIAVAHEVEKTMVLAAACGSAESLSEVNEERVWGTIADLDLLGSTCIRLSVPITSVEQAAAFCKSVISQSMMAVDAGAGIVRLAFDVAPPEVSALTNRIRAELAFMGGTVFLERAPFEVKAEIGAWNDPGPAAMIMRAIKSRMDPQSILSPGRFVAGI
jgi:glycolate oxidase FAD binding subunit